MTPPSTISRLAKQAAFKQAIDSKLRAAILGGALGGLGGYAATPYDEDFEAERKNRNRNTLLGTLAGGLLGVSAEQLRPEVTKWLKPETKLNPIAPQGKVKHPIATIDTNPPRQLGVDPEFGYYSHVIKPTYEAMRDHTIPAMPRVAGGILSWLGGTGKHLIQALPAGEPRGEEYMRYLYKNTGAVQPGEIKGKPNVK